MFVSTQIRNVTRQSLAFYQENSNGLYSCNKIEGSIYSVQKRPLQGKLH